MIDLRQFIALKAVSQTKSIARAAENLGWSQPTVNYHLNNLEAELGAPLLNRTKRGSELTPVAQQLVPKIEEILVLCERSINEAKTTASETSTPLRFGIFPTAAAHLLPGITASLSKTKYKVQATLEEVALLVSKLQKREIDAALSYTTPNVSFALDSNFPQSNCLTTRCCSASQNSTRLPASPAPPSPLRCLTVSCCKRLTTRGSWGPPPVIRSTRIYSRCSGLTINSSTPQSTPTTTRLRSG